MKRVVKARQVMGGGIDAPLHFLCLFLSQFIEQAPSAWDWLHVSSQICTVSINHAIVNPTGHMNCHLGWKTILMV